MKVSLNQMFNKSLEQEKLACVKTCCYSVLCNVNRNSTAAVLSWRPGSHWLVLTAGLPLQQHLITGDSAGESCDKSERN